MSMIYDNFFEKKPPKNRRVNNGYDFQPLLNILYVVFIIYKIIQYIVFLKSPYAWKSCVPRKGTEGSNPSLCAT